MLYMYSRVQCFFMRTAKTLVRLDNVFDGRTGNFVDFVVLRLKFQRQEGYFSNNIMYKKFLTKENRMLNEIDMRDFRGDNWPDN